MLQMSNRWTQRMTNTIIQTIPNGLTKNRKTMKIFLLTQCPSIDLNHKIRRSIRIENLSSINRQHESMSNLDDFFPNQQNSLVKKKTFIFNSIVFYSCVSTFDFVFSSRWYLSARHVIGRDFCDVSHLSFTEKRRRIVCARR